MYPLEMVAARWLVRVTHPGSISHASPHAFCISPLRTAQLWQWFSGHSAFTPHHSITVIKVKSEGPHGKNTYHGLMELGRID